jgi:magnesium chelatase family protein
MQITSFALGGLYGVDAHAISIRCDIDAAAHAAFIVKGVSALQSKEIGVRVRSAISATPQCKWPGGRVAISLDTKGSSKFRTASLDLAIALVVMGVDVNGLLVAGELGFEGFVLPVRGAFQMAFLAQTMNLRGVLVSVHNVQEILEAVLVGPHVGATPLPVYGSAHLVDIVNALAKPLAREKPAEPGARQAIPTMVDFSDVLGQASTLSAVEQCVQSRCGLLLSGPPCAAKMMIARRVTSVMPQLQHAEQIAVTRVYSSIGLTAGLMIQRPFRAPHHTISAAGLAGSSSLGRPGEVHLAAHGVLFLDEIQEFGTMAIDALAQALREMPAASRPLVMASTCGCPCGWRDSGVRACTCADAAIKSHAARVRNASTKLGVSFSTPVQTVASLRDNAPGESSASIARRIARARRHGDAGA